MRLWEDGSIPELLKEGRTIQKRLHRTRPPHQDNQLACSFSKLMFEGKTHAALQLLSDKGNRGVLHLDNLVPMEPTTVMDVLSSKHPLGQPASHDAVIPGAPLEVHPVIFNSIDATVIRSISLHTRGAASPSGMDAYDWRRLCTSFRSASNALCHSLALTAKRLCTVLVDPSASPPSWRVASSLGQKPRSEAHWHWGDCSANHCQGCPCSDQARHPGSNRISPALCRPNCRG